MAGKATALPAREPKRAPTLPPEGLLEAYRLMLLSRGLDERIYALNRQGKVPIMASAQGHEAAQIASVWAMDRTRDLFFTYYRDLAGTLALGYSAKELMLGYMGKEGAPLSGGRQFPLVGADPARRVFNTSNVVATQLPRAVGAAMACKMRREPAATIVYFGDGATSEGEWHEALNFAGIHRVPVVFFCENNGYAISLPLRKQMAVQHVADRAPAYGMPGITVDGADFVETYNVTWEAARRARAGQGPTLIEALVPRLRPHTTDDDERRYRSVEEMAAARERDPVPRMQRLLSAGGLLTPQRDEELRRQAQLEIDEATAYAEAAPLPSPATFYDHVYAAHGAGP